VFLADQLSLDLMEASSLSVSATKAFMPSAILVVAHTSAFRAMRKALSLRSPPLMSSSAHAALGSSMRGNGASVSASRVSNGGYAHTRCGKCA
jgi:hypothetical protein